MKKIIVITAIIITLLSLNKEQKVIIPKDSIRFRVIANSDKKADQDLKKKVVTNLKNSISTLEYQTKDLENSRTNIKRIIPEFSSIVEQTLIENSSNQTYKINYGMNYFPEKEYKGTKYEAGQYESLVITLGDGLGENFWCVLFPPLCLLEAEDEDSTTDLEYTSFVKEIIDKYF